MGNLPGGFVPQEDEGYCMINVQLPEASSLERTQAFLEQVNKIIGETPGLRDYMTISGYSILDGAAIPNAGFSIMVFNNWCRLIMVRSSVRPHPWSLSRTAENAVRLIG